MIETRLLKLRLLLCIIIENKLLTDKCRGPEHYACAVNPYEESCIVRCITKTRMCDGIIHCPLGDDEYSCGLGELTDESITRNSDVIK